MKEGAVMKFEAYIAEMKRLGWTDEELRSDYELNELSRINDLELPWFPQPKPAGDKNNKEQTVFTAG